MTLKSFVLGIFFRIARKICFRYFKSKIWQKIWKCSGFAVFFQGIFLKSNVYKNEENALFLLCFFLSNLFKNIFSFERFDLKNTTKIELFLLFLQKFNKKRYLKQVKEVHGLVDMYYWKTSICETHNWRISLRLARLETLWSSGGWSPGHPTWFQMR